VGSEWMEVDNLALSVSVKRIIQIKIIYSPSCCYYIHFYGKQRYILSAVSHLIKMNEDGHC